MSCPWKAADAPTRATNFHSASVAMPMESSTGPHSSNRFLFSLFGCQQTQSKQPTAAKMVTGSKGDEMGASVAPGKKHCSGVRVDGANVVWDCLTPKNQKRTKLEQVWHQVKNTAVGSELMEQMCYEIV